MLSSSPYKNETNHDAKMTSKVFNSINWSMGRRALELATLPNNSFTNEWSWLGPMVNMESTTACHKTKCKLNKVNVIPDCHIYNNKTPYVSV